MEPDSSANVVELVFPVQGAQLPADHGYPLYSAISRLLPSIHEEGGVAIQTVKGVRDGRGNICLSGKPVLRIRLPLQKVPEFYGLAGKKLQVGDKRILLGSPIIMGLNPSERLWSRLVVIKVHKSGGKLEPETFTASAVAQLAELGINGKVSLEMAVSASERDEDRSEETEDLTEKQIKKRDAYARRIVTIKGTALVGYGVHVTGLSDEDSLRLLSLGLGGRRKMGCGVFVPVPVSNN